MMTDTTKKAPETGGVNCMTVPDPREKLWVVLVCDLQYWSTYEDEDGRIQGVNANAFTLRYALSPGGGGPASVYNEKTWGDRSMAAQRAGMVADKLNRGARPAQEPQAVKLGFVADERLHWADGEPVDGERVEPRGVA